MTQDKGLGLKSWLSGPKKGEAKLEGARETGAVFDKHRLAVLPLASMSPNIGDTYFADGMTEELITVLSQLQDIRVIARTSVDHYKSREKGVSQIAQELRVGSVMEGSVRMAGDRLRVTVQLINTGTEEHVWSETYDRKLDDIFAIQDDIAKRVAQSLQMKFLEKRAGPKETENISAYVNYLKGRGILSKRKSEEFKQALGFFEDAIRDDPQFAPGYSGLADVYFLMGDYGVLPFPPAQRRAKELVTKALELDPELAEAHTTLALLLLERYDFSGAEDEFRKAISRNKSYEIAHLWYSYCLGALGKFESALDEMRQAEDADPLSIHTLCTESQYLLLLGRKEEAAKKLNRILELDPDHWMATDARFSESFLKGDYQQAVSIVLGSKHPKDLDHLQLKGDLAMAYAAKGDKESAVRWLREIISGPEERWKNSVIASIYATLGDKDQFFTFANRAFNENTLSFIDFRLIDRWLPSTFKASDDPRFADLLQRAKLPLRSDIFS